jgi:hypothetical protein
MHPTHLKIRVEVCFTFVPRDIADISRLFSPRKSAMSRRLGCIVCRTNKSPWQIFRALPDETSIFCTKPPHFLLPVVLHRKLVPNEQTRFVQVHSHVYRASFLFLTIQQTASLGVRHENYRRHCNLGLRNTALGYGFHFQHRNSRTFPIESLAHDSGRTLVRPNTVIRRNLQIPRVKEEICRYSSQYSARLSAHSNALTVKLIALPDNRRMRRHLPNYLPTRFPV